ncbi:MAG: hypothetical protein J6U04_10020 [Salinivirgaceae bacterium]|nr:hypothetical protein [Salinivirgaceae bacterium]
MGYAVVNALIDADNQIIKRQTISFNCLPFFYAITAKRFLPAQSLVEIDFCLLPLQTVGNAML